MGYYFLSERVETETFHRAVFVLASVTELVYTPGTPSYALPINSFDSLTEDT